MKTLYMTKGLPGSGKSTKAKKMMENDRNIVRVNKDSLRAMLHNYHWSKFNEGQVLKIRDLIIVNTLESGRHIIVDDTNLNPRHEARLKQLAKENKAEFKVIDMTDVSLDTCIKQDLMREKSVGKDVIVDMYNKFLRPTPPVIEYDPSLTDCYVFDIDGTVALMDGRSPYDWHRVGEDKPNGRVVEIARQLNRNHYIIFLSGRDGICKPETKKWFEDNLFDIEYEGLYMRPEGDNRPDTVVKEELYREYIQGKYNVLAVFDDRKKVVDMWRSLGLTCLQVAEGDF